MHYYSFHISDYISHTRHLSVVEDCAYRRLLDLYYLHEQPLNECLTTVARSINMREYEAEVGVVLGEFFELVDGVGWVSSRADQEILKYQTKLEAASRAGKASAQRRSNERLTDVQPTNNHKPITNNQLKELGPQPKKSKGTRLDQSWELPDEWAIWAKQNRSDLNVNQTADGFKDYWIAAPGAKGVKADWFATWRNWVRNQKAGKASEPSWAQKQREWVAEATGANREYEPDIFDVAMQETRRIK